MDGQPVPSWALTRTGSPNFLYNSRWRWTFPLGSVPYRLPSKVSDPLRSFFGWAGNILYPGDCQVCAKPLTTLTRVPVCDACLAESVPFEAEILCVQCRTPFVNRAPLDERGCCSLCRLGMRGFDAAYSSGEYDGALRKLIHLFKYHGVFSLERTLVDRLSDALPREQHFDLIAPVPMHWWRRFVRGRNHAESLARALSKRTGIPFADPVHRQKLTPAQARVSRAERRRNVQGVFALRRPQDVKGKRVFLVDDVLTTGSTAGACAAAMKRAGAAHVAVITIARVDRRAWVEPFVTERGRAATAS